MPERSMLPTALLAGCGATLAGAAVFGAVLLVAGALEHGDALLLLTDPPPLPASVPRLAADNAMQVPMSRLLIFGARLPGTDAPDRPEIPDRDIERLLSWSPDSGDDAIIEKLLAQGRMGYAVIEVTPDEIRFSGQPVLSLSGGAVPAEARKGLLITMLYDHLVEATEHHKEMGSYLPALDFTGEVLLAIHPDTPTATVDQVFYTAGQAQYSAFFLAVDDPTPGEVYTGRRGAFVHGLGLAKLTVVQDAEEVSAYVPTGFEQHAPAAEADALIASAREDAALVCGIYVREGVPSFSAALPTLDAMFVPPMQWMAWTIPTDDGEAPQPAPTEAAAPAPWSLSLADTVSALPITLQRLSTLNIRATSDSCSNTTPLASAEPPPAPPALRSALGDIGDSPIIIGALDRSEIDAVVERHMNQIRYCYQRERSKSPGLSGEVVIKFVVAGDGSVSEAATKSASPGMSSVGECISGRFRRFQFSGRGGVAIVSYPLVFSPD